MGVQEFVGVRNDYEGIWAVGDEFKMKGMY